MKENIRMIKEKEKEYIIIMFIHGLEIDMKVNGKTTIKMEREYITIIMVIDLLENIKIIKEKEREYFIIIMVIE